MTDTVDKQTRSELMSRIRSKGNRSTELAMRMALVRAGISGWRLHPKDVTGKPDFVFPVAKVAVFVDGCFWHGCPECGHIPKSNTKYWEEKIRKNTERDQRQRSKLIDEGWIVVRVWEHELQHSTHAVAKARAVLQSISSP